MAISYSLIVFWLVVLSGTAGAQAIDYERARQNYRSVMSGEKEISDFSDKEAREIRIFHQMVIRQPPPNASRECRNAWETANFAVDDLKDSTEDLYKCADSRDFDEDCSSEFDDVEDHQDDYEDAIDMVQLECTAY